MHLFGGYRELVVEGAQQSHTSLYPVELWLTGWHLNCHNIVCGMSCCRQCACREIPQKL